MILIDSRIGSKHYADLLGDKAVLTTLDSADAAFSSCNGDLIGIEIKKIGDAVNCMFSGRLADRQIPLMREQYHHCYLIVEGIWGPSESGMLQYWRPFPSKSDVICGKWADCTSGRKRLMYSAFESWLNSMATLGGIQVRNTCSASATAAWLWQLYNWWQRDSHGSFQVIQKPAGETAALSRPTMLRRMLALLPHVAWDRSGVLAARVNGVQFIKNNGRVMEGTDWAIEGQLAAKSIADIETACSVPNQKEDR